MTDFFGILIVSVIAFVAFISVVSALGFALWTVGYVAKSVGQQIAKGWRRAG